MRNLGNRTRTNYVGEVGTDDFIQAGVEVTFPERLRRLTLLDTLPASDLSQ